MSVIVEPKHIGPEPRYLIPDPPPSIFRLHGNRTLVDPFEDAMHAQRDNGNSDDRAGDDRSQVESACQGRLRALAGLLRASLARKSRSRRGAFRADAGAFFRAVV